jgi:hypothetical protein
MARDPFGRRNEVSWLKGSEKFDEEVNSSETERQDPST